MLFLAGETLGADAAAEWGLIHEAVPAERWEARVEALVARLRDSAPLALRGLKQGIGALQSREVDPERFREHVELRNQALNSRDLAEGRLAFLERRAARFTGE
jgi:2-(1,2-epoxy-1,2-dihydrophenyl)acetyl-CoA isomerase